MLRRSSHHPRSRGPAFHWVGEHIGFARSRYQRARRSACVKPGESRGTRADTAPGLAAESVLASSPNLEMRRHHRLGLTRLSRHASAALADVRVVSECLTSPVAHNDLVVRRRASKMGAPTKRRQLGGDACPHSRRRDGGEAPARRSRPLLTYFGCAAESHPENGSPSVTEGLPRSYYS